MTRPANIGASPSSPGALILNPADASVGNFFVVTADGRLFGRVWNTTTRTWSWQNHGTPPGTKAASAPDALILYPGDKSAGKFFLAAQDGRLFERYWDTTARSWNWTDHGTPPGTKVVTAPGALILNPADPSAGKFFVGTADGRLFERSWDSTARSWGWHDHGTPPGTKVNSAPGALILNPGDPSAGKFFLTTADGRLFERNWDTTARSWGWTDHGKPDPSTTAVSVGPFLPYPGDPSSGYVFGGRGDGSLYGRYWMTTWKRWNWDDVWAWDNGYVGVAPGPMIVNPLDGRKAKIFIGTRDGRLAEYDHDPDSPGADGYWTDHGTPPGTKVATTPGALILYPGDLSAARFFLGCTDGRVFERAWNEAARNWQWIDHGMPA